jgi:DNA helicase HerA-like ATPase
VRTPGDLTTQGHFVYEPVGDPPTQAREFINSCMQAGGSEYQAGQRPAARLVVLEEAHTFLPEWNVALRNQQDQVAVSTRMIMQARKYGITIMLVSQRTAVVSKSALSQCENYIILKTLDHTGLEYLESLVGGEMRDAIPTLDRFEAMCVGPAFNSDEPVIVTLAAP